MPAGSRPTSFNCSLPAGVLDEAVGQAQARDQARVVALFLGVFEDGGAEAVDHRVIFDGQDRRALAGEDAS